MSEKQVFEGELGPVMVDQDNDIMRVTINLCSNPTTMNKWTGRPIRVTVEYIGTDPTL